MKQKNIVMLVTRVEKELGILKHSRARHLHLCGTILAVSGPGKRRRVSLWYLRTNCLQWEGVGRGRLVLFPCAYITGATGVSGFDAYVTFVRCASSGYL